MTEPSDKTIKRLFAASGNVCSFPGCQTPIVDVNGIVLGEICHIKAAKTGGPRFDASQSDLERHDFANLILLCRNHHKTIDDQLHIYSAEVLSGMKVVRERVTNRTERDEDAVFAMMLRNAARAVTISNVSGNVAVASPGAIQGQTIYVKTGRRAVTFTPPLGTVGADQALSRYAEHLIQRYNEFAAKDRPGFSYGAISRNIESHFGSKWKLLPAEKAELLFEYLQSRINGTKLARINKGNGRRSFSTFEEFTAK